MCARASQITQLISHHIAPTHARTALASLSIYAWRPRLRSYSTTYGRLEREGKLRVTSRNERGGEGGSHDDGDDGDVFNDRDIDHVFVADVFTQVE